MRGVFFAKRAILIKLDSVGRVLFVFINVVIALFAFGACKSNSRSCSFSHFLPSRPQRTRFGLNIKLTPRIRSAYIFYNIKFCMSTFFTRFCKKTFFVIIYIIMSRITRALRHHKIPQRARKKPHNRPVNNDGSIKIIPISIRRLS